jgi:hypothetical protein
VAALHGAFLAQRMDGSTDEQSERSGGDAKAIHAQEVRAAARQKAEQVAAKLRR